MTIEANENRIEALEKGQEEIMELLKPIAETYKTVNTLGKWTMALLVFISIMLGIILSYKSLIGK